MATSAKEEEIEGVDEGALAKGRGRFAELPGGIPKKGWKDILIRVKDSISDNNLTLISAGVAFYAMLASFPAIIALVSIYGLFADPGDVVDAFNSFGNILPSDARELFSEQLKEITSASDTGLSWGLGVSILAVLWSASSGVTALIRGIDVAYGETESRGFLKLKFVSLLFTLGFVLFAVISLALVAVLPAVLELVGLGFFAEWGLKIARWPSLALAVVGGLSALYFFGPDRRGARWRWLTVGSVLSATLWLIFSGLFSIYVSQFSSYNETYGALAGVIVLLMWFYLSAFVVLLGAEVNAEIEHQTAKDTTIGGEQPMGERGAVSADNLGEVMEP